MYFYALLHNADHATLLCMCPVCKHMPFICKTYLNIFVLYFCQVGCCFSLSVFTEKVTKYKINVYVYKVRVYYNQQQQKISHFGLY